MTVIDTINRIYREFKRYTGDGLPGEPTGAALPVGDPQSGPYSPKKSEIRAALVEILGTAEEDAEAAAEALAELERLYLGAKASDPTTDNEGGALETGAIYFNTTDGKFRVWTAGDVWQDQSTALGDGEVTEPKHATGGVSTRALAALAVTEEKLASAVQTKINQFPAAADTQAGQFLQRNDDADGYDAITRARARYEVGNAQSVRPRYPRVLFAGSHTGVTYTRRLARYVAAMDCLHIWGDIELLSKGTHTGSNPLTIDLDLPEGYAAPFNNAGSVADGMVYLGRIAIDGMAGGTLPYHVSCYVDQGALVLRKNLDGSEQNVQWDNVTGTARIRYHVVVPYNGGAVGRFYAGDPLPDGAPDNASWPLSVQDPATGRIWMTYIKVGSLVQVCVSDDGGSSFVPHSTLGSEQSTFAFPSFDANGNLRVMLNDTYKAEANWDNGNFGYSVLNMVTGVWGPKIPIDVPEDTWAYGELVHAPLHGIEMYCPQTYEPDLSTAWGAYFGWRDDSDPEAAWTNLLFPTPADGNEGGTEATAIEVNANLLFAIMRTDENENNTDAHDGGYMMVSTSTTAPYVFSAGVPFGDDTVYGDRVRMPQMTLIAANTVRVRYGWYDGAKRIPVYRDVTFSGSTPTVGARVVIEAWEDNNSAPMLFPWDGRTRVLGQPYNSGSSAYTQLAIL